MEESSNSNTTSTTTNRNNSPIKNSANRVVPTSDSTTGYTDYALVTQVKENCGASDSRQTSTNSAFPVTLHALLSEVEQGGIESIVRWCPHGRSILVRDQQAFEKCILPKWFRQKKYSSFQRQLNLYGFQRVTHGFDKGAYYHEKFLRSKRFLAYTIKRTKTKGKGHRKAADPDSEPDFYNMSFLPAAEKVNLTLDDEGLPLVRKIAAQYHEEIVAKRSPAVFFGRSDSDVSTQLQSITASSPVSATSVLEWLDSLPYSTSRRNSLEARPLIPNVMAGSVPPPLFELLTVPTSTSPLNLQQQQLLLRHYHQQRQSLLSTVQWQRQLQQQSNLLSSFAEQLVAANEREKAKLVADAAFALGDNNNFQTSSTFHGFSRLFPATTAAAAAATMPTAALSSLLINSNNPMRIHDLHLQNLLPQQGSCTTRNPTSTMLASSTNHPLLLVGDNDRDHLQQDTTTTAAALGSASFFHHPQQQQRK